MRVASFGNRYSPFCLSAHGLATAERNRVTTCGKVAYRDEDFTHGTRAYGRSSFHQLLARCRATFHAARAITIASFPAMKDQIERETPSRLWRLVVVRVLLGPSALDHHQDARKFVSC